MDLGNFIYKPHQLFVHHVNKKSAIKRPLNQYQLFYKEKVPEFKARNPNMSSSELSHLISDEWNRMTLVQKLPYKKQADELLTKFAEDHPDLTAINTKQSLTIELSPSFIPDPSKYPDLFTMEENPTLLSSQNTSQVNWPRILNMVNDLHQNSDYFQSVCHSFQPLQIRHPY